MSIFSKLAQHLSYLITGYENPFIPLALKSLGILMMSIGAGGGLYFLLQFFTPFIGYLESGFLMSSFFLLGGFFLLRFTPRKKAPQTIDTLSILKTMKDVLPFLLSIKPSKKTMIPCALCLSVLALYVKSGGNPGKS